MTLVRIGRLLSLATLLLLTGVASDASAIGRIRYVAPSSVYYTYPRYAPPGYESAGVPGVYRRYGRPGYEYRTNRFEARTTGGYNRLFSF